MATHKKDIFQFVEQLEKTKEEIHPLLKDFKSKGLAEREKTGFSVMEDVLKIIGKGLYNAVKNYTGNDDLKFYFYPGYTTLNGDRVLIKSNLIAQDERDNPMFTGIGYVNDKEFMNCPSALYYEAVIAEIKELDYLGPTTHNWKRQQENQIKILLKDETPLKILVIEKGNNPYAKSEESICHIKFNGEKIKKVTSYISRKLSPKSSLLKVGVDGGEYKPWPTFKPESLKLSGERIKQLTEVQKLVYPIWFAATFSDLLQSTDSKQEIDVWLNSIMNVLLEKGYSTLSERIKRFRKYEENYLENNRSEYSNIHFSHWYSFFFDTKEHKQELGSAMILTDQKIPREFLFYASTWLQQIYGMMRKEDYALEVERNTWKSNFTKLSHSQNQYFEAMKEYVNTSDIGEEQKKVILHYHELLQGFLEVAKNFDDLNKYVASKKSSDTIEHFSELQDSVATLKLLFANTDILKNSFKLISDGVKYLDNFQKDTLFTGNFSSSDSLSVSANKVMFKLLVKDLLVNAIENSDEANPIIEISIRKENGFAIFKIGNNNAPSEKELQGILNPDLLSGKYGLQIIKALRTALGWEMNFPTDLKVLEKTNKFYFEFKIPIS